MMENTPSLSVEGRVRLVEAKIGEWLDKNNKAQLLVAQQWLDANRMSLKQDDNAKMLEEKHWLEAIDPLHRYGSNLWFYFKEWKDSESSKTFFEWLDNVEGKDKDLKECRRHKLDGERVSYLQKQVERESFEVAAKNGKMYYKGSDNTVDTKSEKWIYALSPCRKMFLRKKEKGSFHHSSFLAGAPVVAAGFIQVLDGIIMGLSGSSGHYKPTKENLQRLTRFLEEEQVDFTNVSLRLEKI